MDVRVALPGGERDHPRSGKLGHDRGDRVDAAAGADSARVAADLAEGRYTSQVLPRRPVLR